MPRFPKAEAEIVALAHAMRAGFLNNPHFPAPPVPVEALDALIQSVAEANKDVQDAEAALKKTYAAKERAVTQLTQAVRSDLWYGKAVARNNAARLKQIGWNTRAPATQMQVPGNCGPLQGVRQGEGMIMLRWTRPKQGGKPEGYHIERRLRDGGAWEATNIAFSTTFVLTNQPSAVELEYRVIAGNQAGDGTPSNIVVAVL
jgi:predicted DNA-binding ArsR family transcriptional regulator